MKRAKIFERRVYFVRCLCRFLSLKDALEVTASKFKVRVSTLRMDWSRRDSWPKEILEEVNDTSRISVYKKEICRTLAQTEYLIGTTKNDNCKLGATKLRISTLLKLIQLENSCKWKELWEKVETLENQLKEKGVLEKQGEE